MAIRLVLQRGRMSSRDWIGVVLILLFSKPFARLVEALLPDRGAELTRSLDPLIPGILEMAVETTKAKVEQIVRAEVAHLRSCMGTSQPNGIDFLGGQH